MFSKPVQTDGNQVKTSGVMGAGGSEGVTVTFRRIFTEFSEVSAWFHLVSTWFSGVHLVTSRLPWVSTWLLIDSHGCPLGYQQISKGIHMVNNRFP